VQTPWKYADLSPLNGSLRLTVESDIDSFDTTVFRVSVTSQFSVIYRAGMLAFGLPSLTVEEKRARL
jgi:hypothetical protein